jgi:hypothetical protein
MPLPWKLLQKRFGEQELSVPLEYHNREAKRKKEGVEGRKSGVKRGKLEDFLF